MKIKPILIALFVSILFTGLAGAADNNTTYNGTLPEGENYSSYMGILFQENMSTWDFPKNIASLWESFVGAEIFWGFVLLIPYLMIWNRHNSVLMVAILYLVSGGLIAVAFPPMLAKLAFWFFIAGVAGIVFKMYFRE